MQKNNLVEYSHVNLSCVVKDLLQTSNQNKIVQETQSDNKIKSIKDVDNEESEKPNDTQCAPEKETSIEKIHNFPPLSLSVERLTENFEKDFKNDSTSNTSTSSEEFSNNLHNGLPPQQTNQDRHLLHLLHNNSGMESPNNIQPSREPLHSPQFDPMRSLMSPSPQSKEVIGNMDNFPHPNMLHRPPHLFYFRPQFRPCRNPMPNNMDSPRFMEIRNPCFELNRFAMNAEHFDRRSPSYPNRFHMDPYHPYGPRMPHTFSKPPSQVMMSQMGHPSMGLSQMSPSLASHLQMGGTTQVPPQLRCFTRNPTPYQMGFRPPPMTGANVYFRPYVPSNIPPHLSSVLQDNCRNTSQQPPPSTPTPPPPLPPLQPLPQSQPNNPFLSSLPAIESPVVPLSVDIPALRASDSLLESHNDANELHPTDSKIDNDLGKEQEKNNEIQSDESTKVEINEENDLKVFNDSEHVDENNGLFNNLELVQPLENKKLVIKIPRNVVDFPTNKTENSNEDEVDCHSENKTSNDKENITENSTLENHNVDVEMADEIA